MPAKLTEAQRDLIIDAVRRARGKVVRAVHLLQSADDDAVRIGRTTFYAYCKRYATIQNALDAARARYDEGLLDAAELKLYEAVESGEAWAIKYTLSTKGKARGYSERQEVTGADGGALTLDVKGYTMFNPADWDDDA